MLVRVFILMYSILINFVCSVILFNKLLLNVFFVFFLFQKNTYKQYVSKAGLKVHV